MSTFADNGAVPSATDAAATAGDDAGGPVVHAAGVTAGYGSTKIIDSVDLRLYHGQVVLIAGPNGAGKSTLVKVLVGDLPCLAGRVKILGRDTTGWSTAKLARLGVGYVPQHDHIFLPLPIRRTSS